MSGSFFVEDGYNSENVANLVGPTGATGPTGPPGATGATGPQGAVGAQGPTGATGAQGPQGDVGAQGPAGPTGAQGPAGPAGPTGADGPVGPTGPAGTNGSVGPTGPAGPTGATGATGPAGSSSPWSATTITVPGTRNGRWEHRETIAAVGVTASNVINLKLAPALDTDENDPEMLDFVTLVAIPGTDSFDVLATFSQLQSGIIKLQYQVN